MVHEARLTLLWLQAWLNSKNMKKVNSYMNRETEHINGPFLHPAKCFSSLNLKRFDAQPTPRSPPCDF